MIRIGDEGAHLAGAAPVASAVAGEGSRTTVHKPGKPACVGANVVVGARPLRRPLLLATWLGR